QTMVGEIGFALTLGVLLSVLYLQYVRGDRHHHNEHGRDNREDDETRQDQEQPEFAETWIGRSLSVARSTAVAASVIWGGSRRAGRPRGKRGAANRRCWLGYDGARRRRSVLGRICNDP